MMLTSVLKYSKGFCIAVAACIFLSSCNPVNKTIPSVAAINWQRIGPGGGGATFIPTFSYHNSSNFLVRCDMTGAYLTNDGGDSYRQINFANGSYSFAYDPKDSNEVYIGSSTLNRSGDGGKTWQQIFPLKNEIINEGYTGDHAGYKIATTDSTLYKTGSEKISAIRVDPVQKGAVYFAIGNHLFYTGNNGQSWLKQTLSQPIDYLYTSLVNPQKELYIFSTDSIFTFNKIDKSIAAKALPKAMSPATSFAAGVLKNTGNTIFYALHQTIGKENSNGFGHSEVWISTDMGINWQRSNDPVITNEKSGLNPSYIKLVCSEMDAASAYVVANRYEEKISDKKVANWYGALKTSDAGKSWSWVWKGGGGTGTYGVQDATDANNLNDAWVHKAFGGEFIQLMDGGVSPQDGNIAIVTDWYRTMKTLDGGKTWKEIYSIKNADSTYTSKGMDVTTTYGVHFDPFDSNHIGISYTDIGYHQSFNGGKSWSRSVSGVPGDWVNTCYWVAFDPEVKNKVWSAWSGMHDFPRGKMTRNPQWKDGEYTKGGICISSDGGKTWKPAVEGMGMNSSATCIIIDPASKAGNRTLYATVYNKGVFKSTDDGKTWTLKNKGIDTNTCAFEITLAGNGDLYLTVSPTPIHKDGKKGIGFYSGAVYKSTDGAASWTKLAVNNGLLFPNGMAVDPANPNRIYLACWANIYLSDLVGGDVTLANGGNKLLGTPGGIFMSDDAGKTWASIFDQKQFVYDVTVDPYHAGRLYCNTFNKAAYRSDDYGKHWEKIKGHDFHWGHRIMVDENDHEKVYITTFGSSVWHGVPDIE